MTDQEKPLTDEEIDAIRDRAYLGSGYVTRRETQRLSDDLRKARELLRHFAECGNNECDRRDEAVAFLGPGGGDT